MVGRRVAGLVAALALVVAAPACSGLVEGVRPSISDSCMITTEETSVVVDLEQSKYASIIAGLTLKRALPARAASIALTTAYQESEIRNIDYGDRDSLGLFQQRPSQDWGTAKQIMDPYYSTGAFYDALVKIRNWQKRDITEVAQAVQISAYPDAYRDHESDGRALASALTGHSPAAIACLDRSPDAGDAKGLASALQKTFGKLKLSREADTVTITAKSDTAAWAYGQFAVANLEEYGVAAVTVGDQRWQSVVDERTGWATAEEPAAARQVIIAVR